MNFIYYKNREAFLNDYKINSVDSVKELISIDDVDAFVYFKNLYQNRLFLKSFKLKDFNKKMKSNLINYYPLDNFIVKCINDIYKKMKKLSNKINNLFKTNLFAFICLIIYKIYQTPFRGKKIVEHLSQTNLKLLGINTFIDNKKITNYINEEHKDSLTSNSHTEFDMQIYSNLLISKDRNYKCIVNYVNRKLDEKINIDVKNKIYSLLKIYTTLYYNFRLTKKGDVLCTLK